MKKLTFKPILILAAALLSITACKKDKSSGPVTPVVNDGAELAKVLRSNAPSFESFTINTATGGVATTAKGTKFRFPAHVFVKGDGSPVTGSVTVNIKEIQDVSAMILADRPTITDDGKMLISYGEFFVGAEQGGEKLKLDKDSAVVVQVRQRAAGVKEVPMWSGDSAITSTLMGYDYQNNAVTITKTTYVNKGIEWEQQPGYAFFNGTDGTLDFRLDDLFHWVNCDGLASLPGTKTTVMGYFTNHYNPTTGSNYGGEEPTMLYFKPRGLNSVIKFYNTILAAPSGYEGLHSYQTSVPEGLEGSFLAMSAVDGKFYAELKDVTIGNAGSASYTSVSFNLQEVSASQLLDLIDQMKTK